ncbi:MAG: SapC family protein [Janthinobacterium lividum]
MQLPLFYRSLVPLSSQVHAGYGLQPREGIGFASVTHAVPLTVDEFAVAQRSFPIVFGLGDTPSPLVLLGLTEGQNLYVDAAGRWQAGEYLPAFVRRYPFMLARLSPESTDLSLCFDDSADIVVAGAADRLFDGDEPTETTRNILQFCQSFEQAIGRTRNFMIELERLDLLIDGEVSIQTPDMAEPVVYRGFRMVAEEKLQSIRGDQARKMVQSGVMGLIYAHLFSLSLIPGLFDRQRSMADGASPSTT